MDFAPRAAWRMTHVMFLLAGALGCAHALWQRHVLLQDRSALVTQVEAQAEAQQRAVRHLSPQAQAARPEARAEVERLAAGLQRPWQPMLNALQIAIRNDASVTRVQPEADAFRLRIAGQADSSKAFLDFVQRLQDDASWQSVEPLSESRQPQPEAAAGGKPVSFLLAVEWRQR
ncbi:hypothetical protein [Variovorax defluvii]